MNKSRTFIWMIGPQAVGKMAVGKQLAKELGFQFSHNHHSIEFALKFHPYGSEGFSHISSNMRKLVFENMRKYDTQGFVFTYMMGFGMQSEIDYIQSVCLPFREAGWQILFVELEAEVSTRLHRNSHPDRLEAKASKRNTQLSNERLVASMEEHILNSSNDLPFPLVELQTIPENYLKIVNDSLDITEQVQRIRDYFDFT